MGAAVFALAVGLWSITPPTSPWPEPGVNPGVLPPAHYDHPFDGGTCLRTDCKNCATWRGALSWAARMFPDRMGSVLGNAGFSWRLSPSCAHLGKHSIS
jgi:hypothetical protein